MVPAVLLVTNIPEFLHKMILITAKPQLNRNMQPWAAAQWIALTPAAALRPRGNVSEADRQAVHGLTASYGHPLLQPCGPVSPPRRAFANHPLPGQSISTTRI